MIWLEILQFYFWTLGPLFAIIAIAMIVLLYAPGKRTSYKELNNTGGDPFSNWKKSMSE